jgi:hypothetical protein
VIAKAGLPVPAKSACFMCPSSKRHEIESLPSDLYQLSVKLEENYQSGKHWRGEDAKVTGLGRGKSWTEYRGFDEPPKAKLLPKAKLV